LGWAICRRGAHDGRPAAAQRVEALQAEAASPSVEQHLAAIRMLFDWQVVGQVMPNNPASAVRGPKQCLPGK